MPRQPLNIVVIGGSFAGLAVAHYFLDNVIHQLSTFEGAPTYRIVLVSPSTHLFWNICAPRALVSPNLIHAEDTFVPIEPAFARHPFTEFTFIQGYATEVDTSARRITVELVRNRKENRSSGMSKASTWTEGAERTNSSVARDTNYRANTADRHSKIQTILYHALVIATGSSAFSPLYSLHGTHEDTLAELRSFHKKLEHAYSVVIVGGGASGVETAGQLATYYNQRRRWRRYKDNSLQPTPAADSQLVARAHEVLFPLREPKKNKGEALSPRPIVTPRERQLGREKRDSGTSSQPSITSPTSGAMPIVTRPRIPKCITLLSGGERLLPKLPPIVGKKAEKKLKKLNVHIVHGLREVGNTINADGTTNCILNNDMTITSDVLISATGVEPNTRFLPPKMLNENGYVVTDPQTLRVYSGDRIYSIGDCASYSKNYTLDIYEAVPSLMKNLHNDLLAHEYKLQTVTSIPDPETLKKTISRPTESVVSTEYALPSGRSESPHDPYLSILPIGTLIGRSALTITFRTASTPPRQQFRPEIPLETKDWLGNSPIRNSLESSTLVGYLRPRLSFPAPAPTPPISKPSSSLSSEPQHLVQRKALLTSEEARQKIGALEDAKFEQNPTDSQLMPITRFGGVGVVFDWRMPSFLVYLLKGRNYKLKRAKEAVGKGANPYVRPG